MTKNVAAKTWVLPAIDGVRHSVGGGSSPVVTLKGAWKQDWTETPPVYTQVFGANPITVAPGSTLVALYTGFDNQTIEPPGDSAGTFTARAVAREGSETAGIATQHNASGGEHTITPTEINIGSTGEGLLWIVEVAAMPEDIDVRTSNVNAASDDSQTWSVSTEGGDGSTPQAGDIAFAIFCLENSIQLESAELSDPPPGWVSIGVSQDAAWNLPTQVSYRIVASDGHIEAVWTNEDPNITHNLAAILVLGTADG